MRIVDEIRDILDDIGLREIQISPNGGDRTFRASGTVPLSDGEISNAVQVEKLTWMSLPSGRDLRIRRLEVENRTEERLRIGMDLFAGRDGRPAVNRPEEQPAGLEGGRIEEAGEGAVVP